ncbi:MAG: helix-turn-helix transcriptional regulator [Clostridia bacterium]|nr:helix-turn-helix transcriptional regulator [Clostridia bacterium]
MERYYTEKENRALKGPGTEVFYQTNGPRVVSARAHIHSSTELLWIERGTYRISLDGRAYDAKAGDLVLLRPFTIHHATTGDEPENAYHVIKIRSSFLQEFSTGEAFGESLAELTLCRDDSKVLWTAREVEEAGLLPALTDFVAEETPRPFREMGLRIGAGRLLLLLLRDLSARRPAGELPTTPPGSILKIYSALLLINRRYVEDLTEESCAAEIGFSRCYFSRLFRRVVGVGFKQYLTGTRLRRAEKELLTTDRPVGEIAAAVGFNSVAYFISCFREKNKVSPTAYRRAARA